MGDNLSLALSICMQIKKEKSGKKADKKYRNSYNTY